MKYIPQKFKYLIGIFKILLKYINIIQLTDLQYRKFVKQIKQYMKLSELFMYQTCTEIMAVIILHQNENRF